MNSFGHNPNRPYEVKERLQFVGRPETVRKIKKLAKELKVSCGDLICKVIEGYIQNIEEEETKRAKNIRTNELCKKFESEK